MAYINASLIIFIGVNYFLSVYWLWISEILKVWQEINLMDAQNIVMNTTKIQNGEPR